MQALFDSIIQTLQTHAQNTTGQCCPRADFRLAKTAPLSCRSFVRGGAAGEAAAQMQAQKAACHWNKIPLLQAVRHENGWILFDFMDAFYTALCEAITKTACSPAPATDEDELYLINRLRIWQRHGSCACPPDPQVQRALWLAFCDTARVKKLHKETQRAILTMTHHKDGPTRIELEHAIGGVAQAILHLMNSCDNMY